MSVQTNAAIVSIVTKDQSISYNFTNISNMRHLCLGCMIQFIVPLNPPHPPMTPNVVQLGKTLIFIIPNE